MLGKFFSTRRRAALAVVGLLAVGLVPLTAGPAQAATFTVNNCNDNNIGGTLRQAVAAANAALGPDVINFAVACPAAQPIALMIGEMIVNDDLTILGPGPDNLVISASVNDRIFEIIAGNRVTIAGVTLTNGTPNMGGGGAIRNVGSDLTLTNSVLSGNSGNEGAAINNIGGTVTVANSTLVGNSADHGGGIHNDGGSVTVTNSTLSGNFANAGGGIYTSGGTVVVVASTLANVTAPGQEGGNGGQSIHNSFGTVFVVQTIMVNDNLSQGCFGTFTSGGDNLTFPDNSCPGTIVDPMLGPLGDNGGLTLTHALLPGSPAVDAVTPAGPCGVATDQRGVSRPQTADGSCDIGAVERAAVADVAVAKAASDHSVTVGDEVTYTITVTNHGPDVVRPAAAQLVDTFPGAMGFVSADNPACTTPPVGSSGAVACPLPILNPGDTTTLTVVATADAAGSATDTATVSFAGIDPQLGNNTAQSTVNIAGGSGGPVADLSVAKSASTYSTTVGGQVTYAITVTNNGPDAVPAGAAQVIDSLPGAMTFVSVDLVGCNTPPVGSSGAVACSLPTFGSWPPGLSFTLNVVATANAAGSATDTATITFTGTDPQPGNNTAQSTINISAAPAPGGPVADLAVAKSASSYSATVGDEVTYTITVKNNGSDAVPAGAAQLVDTFPGAMTFVSAANLAGCTTPPVGSSGAVACPLPLLNSGDTATLTVVARAAATGPATDTATVTLTGTDPEPGNNTAQSTINISAAPAPAPGGPVADLAVAKSASSYSATVGDEVTYTITVKNNGSDAVPAGAAQLVDTFPGAMTFVSAANLAGCTTPPVGSSGAVACPLPLLNSGDTATLTVVARAAATGPATDTATVTLTGTDPQPGNNTAQSTINITEPPALGEPVANLAIVKSASNYGVALSGQTTFTLTVSNNGPDAVTGAVVTDTLPASMTQSGPVTAPGASCVTPGVGFSGTITCTLATLNDGANTAISIPVTVNDEGLFTNTASVSPGPGAVDPSLGDNVSSASVNVTFTSPAPGAPIADLSVVKQASPATVGVGGNTVYTVTVKNEGGAVVTGAQVDDPLPAGVSFVSLNPPAGGTCSSPPPGFTGTVSCTLAPLGSGASVSFTITAKALMPGLTTNTVAVGGPAFRDPRPANNVASAAVNVPGPPPPAGPPGPPGPRGLRGPSGGSGGGEIIVRQDGVSPLVSESGLAFRYRTKHLSPTSFKLMAGKTRKFDDLERDTYTVTQDTKSGWKLSKIKCDDPSGDTKVDLKGRKATVKVRPGEQVTCVFTNKKK